MNYYKFFGKVLASSSKSLFSKISVPVKPLCRHQATRRSFLYVPGDDTYKLKKALTLNTDCIVMDCEDGVAKNKKTEARETIAKFLDEGPVTDKNPEWCVRINSFDTPELLEADVTTLLSAKNLPAGICLPKVNHVDQLQLFAEKVWNALIKRPENSRGPLKLIMLIETPYAIMTLPEICKKAEDLSSMAPLIPEALVLGSDDLIAGLGATRTESGVELFYARQKLVLVAKAFGLQAIDVVCINYSNEKKFKEECEEAALMGYTGKQCIHPGQVAIAMEKFVPSRSKIQWAQKVIKAFNENQEQGKGAFKFQNIMIDMPSVRQAQNILNTARAAAELKD